jgi:hypothetical protein
MFFGYQNSFVSSINTTYSLLAQLSVSGSWREVGRLHGIVLLPSISVSYDRKRKRKLKLQDPNQIKRQAVFYFEVSKKQHTAALDETLSSIS